MKGVLLWILITLAGAFSGYWIARIFDFNNYLIAATGAIVGSSLAITIIIQQKRNKKYNFKAQKQELDDEV